jgi:trehalose synthase-fused probable maltokinase
VSHLDAEWLSSQRWFRSKQRRIEGITEVDRAPLGERAALAVIEVAYGDDGQRERYLVPLVSDHEPVDGEGAWAALAAVMATGRELLGKRGRFVAKPLHATHDDEMGGPPTERRLRVEQSNTSVVIGERLMLKLYRLLEPGDNPDVEVGAFLTQVGFTQTPAVVGALTYIDADGTNSAAAMLQEFVPALGDAWSATLTALATDPGAATQIAADAGVLTRGLHDALASRPDDAEFPARIATPDELAQWRTSAEQQLTQATGAVTGEARDQLVGLAPRVMARFAEGFGSGSRGARVSRIHGDYHLGQLLARADGGYSVIDFEGEPARPLAERRTPASPLRDVAGMLRSLDYAARTAETAATWLEDTRARFLDGYGGIRPDEQRLVDAFELEKACYEVGYEANNRPDWLWLPFAAIERLASR